MPLLDSTKFQVANVYLHALPVMAVVLMALASLNHGDATERLTVLIDLMKGTAPTVHQHAERVCSSVVLGNVFSVTGCVMVISIAVTDLMNRIASPGMLDNAAAKDSILVRTTLTRHARKISRLQMEMLLTESFAILLMLCAVAMERNILRRRRKQHSVTRACNWPGRTCMLNASKECRS